jgi:PDZ domain-containing protein
VSTPTPADQEQQDEPAAAEQKKRSPGRRLSRRGWTVLISSVLVIVFLIAGFVVPVPYVAIGPGPTYDTLGSVKDVTVVQIDGHEVAPTHGQLRMTTVQVSSDVTLFGALGLWISGRYALAPREEYFPDGETEDQVSKENVKMFQDSQSNAEVAALRTLKFPIKVLAGEIVAGAPADKAIAPGDQLINVNGNAIHQQEQVRAALLGSRPGQKIPIVIKHGAEAPKTVSITLGTPPDDRKEGFIGLTAVDRADVKFKTTINLADVGGPSAGLIFALAIVDRLGGEDLAAGQTIAGTGEIDVKGNVSPIGGIPFKLVSAREDGATTFLVPAENCAEAKERVPDGLQLVRVENLQGAIDALRNLKAHRPVPSC